jgi:hypothetical protein
MTIIHQQASGLVPAGGTGRTRARVAAAIAAFIALAGLISGCSGAADDAGRTPAAPTQGAASSTNTGTKISPLEQKYEGDSIVEILGLNNSSEDPGPGAAVGGEIDAINGNIRATLQGALDKTSGSDSWADIRSYPFTSADYLQIVTTSVIYPTYGTEGDVFSWVFARNTNTWIKPEGVYAEAGLAGDALVKAVSEAFVPDSPAESVAAVEPSAFRYVHGDDGWFPEFLIKVTVANQGAEPWDGLYSYRPDAADGQTLTKLNASCLFDQAEMDVMDPPLMYAQGSCEGAGAGQNMGG